MESRTDTMSPIIKTDLIFEEKNRPNLDNFSLKKRTKTDLWDPKKHTFVTKTNVCNKKKRL